MSKRPPDFHRNLVYHQTRTVTGRDVLAVSRCLHRLGYRWKPPTDAYGWAMRDNVQLYRRRQNMNDIGVYDQPTHSHLAPNFDEYERWLYTHVQAPPSPDPVDNVGRLMHSLWTCYAQRPWHYRMVRPFILYPVGRHIAYTFDCSWYVTQVFYMSGLPDPNGFGYRGGVGNTGTLAAHGTRVSDPRPGDLIFYSDPDHVGMACSERNVMGFGSEGGPRVAPQGYRTISQIRRYV
jgi:cell wall-associated NlpC family hydrolase